MGIGKVGVDAETDIEGATTVDGAGVDIAAGVDAVETVADEVGVFVPDVPDVGVLDDDGGNDGTTLAVAATSGNDSTSTATARPLVVTRGEGGTAGTFEGGAGIGISIGLDPFNVYC